MTKIEALELELAARKMVEGTGLDWWEVIKMARLQKARPFSTEVKFSEPIDDYKLAIGIVEGKAVWKGDVLFHTRYGMVVARAGGTKGYLKVENTNISHKGSEYLASCFSWNPPNPKIVMVKLTVEGAKTIASFWDAKGCDAYSRIGISCRESLENLK